MRNEEEFKMRERYKEMGYRLITILKNSFRQALKGSLYFVLIIMLALTIRVFFIEFYKIPSSSMEPTLIPGDFIMVSKMSYGARILKIRKFFKEGKIEYIRTWGCSHIKKGDVFVFNWPCYYTLNDSFPNMYGGCIVKRCFGMPGDTVLIKNEGNKELRMENVDLMGTNTDLFPHDSTLKWKVDNYGPLFVPGKGKKMLLTPSNAQHYKDVLLYEGFKIDIRNDSVFLNGAYTRNITFSHNYYFMKGDNFYGSQDSRFWGFVPEENIVGKAKIILFSLDSTEPLIRSFRWNHFFTRIK